MSRRPVIVSVEESVRPRLVSLEDGAAYLGMSPSWVKGKLACGELSFIRFGRRRLLELRELDAYIEARRHRCGRRAR